MFPHNTEYDNLTKEQLLEKDYELFQTLHTDYDIFQELSKSYIHKMNHVLTSNSPSKLEDFLSILKEPEFLWCGEYSYDLKMLGIFQTVIPMECKLNLSPSILSIHSVEDLTNCFIKTSFYFRRMEFDFPLEEQLEILELMNEYNLTPIYFYVLLQNGFFDRRLKIAQQLSNLYTSLNQSKWAALFSSFKF